MDLLLKFFCLSLMFILFVVAPFFAYAKGYRKVAINMFVALTTALIMFVLDSPLENKGGWDFSGIFFMLTFLFVVLPLYAISYVCWLVAFIRNKRKMESVESSIEEDELYGE